MQRHLSFGRAGRNGVDRDLSRSKFNGKTLRERLDGGFAGSVE